MATGDSTDFLTRIKALLPNGWFTGSTPVLDAILTGISSALASVYSLTAYARLQTRINTATEGFLDLISFDFFGSALPRKAMEGDTAFRTRISAELLLEKGTRKGLIRALEILTGRTPVVFEPARPADTGGYNTSVMGYGSAGRYGSIACPYQCFVTAYRPTGTGIPNVNGYNGSIGGYSTPSQLKYSNLSQIQGAVTDSDIYAAIANTAEEGTICWTQLIS
jgi:hypothetical protein